MHEERPEDVMDLENLEYVLRRNEAVIDRDFLRGSDRDNIEYDLRRRMAEVAFQRDGELFDRRLRERDKLDDLESRRRERSEVSGDDRDGLRFRDAAMHSTAVGALEGITALTGAAEQEEVIEDEEDE